MARKTVYIATAGLLALLVGYIFQVSRELRVPVWTAVKLMALRTKVAAQGGPEVPPAYTIELAETLYSNGYGGRYRNGDVAGKSIFARRSDGSTLYHYFHTGMKLPDGTTTRPTDEGQIVDVPGNASRVLQTLLKAVTTYPANGTTWVRDHSQVWPTAESDCMLTNMGGAAFSNHARVVGNDTILGHRTVIVQFGPPGKVEFKKWLAPDLGCAFVKTEYYRGDDGKGHRAMTTQVPVRIVVGEPDPALFSLDGLDELSPRQAYERKMDFWGYDDATKVAMRAQNAQQLEQQEYRYAKASSPWIKSLEAGRPPKPPAPSL